MNAFNAVLKFQLCKLFAITEGIITHVSSPLLASTHTQASACPGCSIVIIFVCILHLPHSVIFDTAQSSYSWNVFILTCSFLKGDWRTINGEKSPVDLDS